MDRLESELLLEAYERAIELGLEAEFISLLKEEIEMRTSESYEKEEVFA